MTKNFAVLGSPIHHSLSPLIHGAFARSLNIDLHYEKIECLTFGAVQAQLALIPKEKSGLNITLPYKRAVFDFLQPYTTERAQQSLSVNTVFWQDGHLWGDSTDGIGLIRDLAYYKIGHIKNVLMIGAGGAAYAVIPHLIRAGAQSFLIANRTIENAQKMIEHFQMFSAFSPVTWQVCDLNFSHTPNNWQADLIINASSAALQNEVAFPTHSLFNIDTVGYDMFYKKDSATLFQTQCQKNNLKNVSGLGMLIEQAAESFFIWNKVKPDTQSLRKTLEAAIAL